MKKETKHIIRTLGTILFILYVLALIYFLFFSEEYGRAAMEERQYRYNLIPFVEIRRFWVYRKQLGLMAVVTNLFGNVIGFRCIQNINAVTIIMKLQNRGSNGNTSLFFDLHPV